MRFDCVARAGSKAHHLAQQGDGLRVPVVSRVKHIVRGYVLLHCQGLRTCARPAPPPSICTHPTPVPHSLAARIQQVGLAHHAARLLWYTPHAHVAQQLSPAGVCGTSSEAWARVGALGGVCASACAHHGWAAAAQIKVVGVIASAVYALPQGLFARVGGGTEVCRQLPTSVGCALGACKSLRTHHTARQP